MPIDTTSSPLDPIKHNHHRFHRALVVIAATAMSMGGMLSPVKTSAQVPATVVTYRAPNRAIPLSSDFAVTANGEPVDVYRIKVAPQFIGYVPCPSYYEPSSMAYFDFSGSVTVSITSAVPISTVAIRPLRHGIQPTVSGDTIYFTLSRPLNLSIEINGDDRHNLHLFANPLEQDVPSPSDPNVIYYGPGVHGNGSIIDVGSGKTVYIAGGAVVYGSMFGGSNTTIRGRGIVSGEMTPKEVCTSAGGTLLFHLDGGIANMEGIIALDASSWNFGIRDVSNFTMDNVKAIAWRGNGDGIDFLSVSQATVRNVFIRSTDDTFAIKSNPYYVAQTGRPTENLTIEDSVNWADGAGHAISIDELNDPYSRNILLRNMDIIHSYVPILTSGCCGSSGELYNVTLDDIRVEDMRGPAMFELWANGSFHIRDIHVNNFRVLGGAIAPSTIRGADSSHMVANITFNNLNYLGQTIMSSTAGQFQIGGFTSNIRFTRGGPSPSAAPPSAPR